MAKDSDPRHRRQIIIVTHNANLVVNTDADQVIVASAGGHRPGQLPETKYTSGSLENPTIRQQVCEILAGVSMPLRSGLAAYASTCRRDHGQRLRQSMCAEPEKQRRFVYLPVGIWVGASRTQFRRLRVGSGVPGPPPAVGPSR